MKTLLISVKLFTLLIVSGPALALEGEAKILPTIDVQTSFHQNGLTEYRFTLNNVDRLENIKSITFNNICVSDYPNKKEKKPLEKVDKKKTMPRGFGMAAPEIKWLKKATYEISLNKEEPLVLYSLFRPRYVAYEVNVTSNDEKIKGVTMGPACDVANKRPY